MVRNVLSLFLPVNVGRLWLPVVGEGGRHTTSIAIDGQVRLPYDLRNQLVSNRPAVVARFAESGKVAGFELVTIPAADSCWETPIGCRFSILLDDLSPGRYRFSFELLDPVFRSSGGREGETRLIAYLRGPSSGPGSPRPTDPGEATIVSVEAGGAAQHLEMGC